MTIMQAYVTPHGKWLANQSLLVLAIQFEKGKRQDESLDFKHST